VLDFIQHNPYLLKGNPEYGLAVGLGRFDHGDYRSAIRITRRCLEWKPDWPEAMNNPAWFHLLSCGNWKTGMWYARMALRRFPDGPEFLDTLAMAYYLGKHYHKTYRAAQAGLQRNPSLAYSWFIWRTRIGKYITA